MKLEKKKQLYNKRKISTETKLIILLNLITLGLVIGKILISGISSFSTIGYFG